MPSWDWRCVVCGHTFTLTFATATERDAWEDGHPLNCPACRRIASCERQASSAAIVFKGAGWTPKFSR